MDPASNTRVFPFGIFSDNDPIQIFGLDVAERPFDPRQQTRRTHVGVLVKRLADGKTQSPKGDMIRYTRVSGRTKVDRIKPPQGFKGVFRHHSAVLEVVVGSPRELLDLQLEAAIAGGDSMKNTGPRVDDLATDAVAGDSRDRIFTHF
jgi:hypothetical protein